MRTSVSPDQAIRREWPLNSVVVNRNFGCYEHQRTLGTLRSVLGNVNMHHGATRANLL
jgi:hypothetical protein